MKNVFKLEDLPYAPNALEPIIDKETMVVHREKHHQTYVNNLNAQIEIFPELEELSLEDIMKNVSKFSPAVRNNVGGVYNHNIFWKMMAPVGKCGKPSEKLMSYIERDFKTLENLKEQFLKAGLTQFGSGWAWIIVDKDKKLSVAQTSNQDNPLMDIALVKGTPILTVDIWEHAYYLKYQNRRVEYLANWWDVINWNEVNTLFESSLK